MHAEVTRDVVRDLWPLCRSGDASEASRSLVERYLAEDPALASALRQEYRIPGLLAGIHLSPEAERRLLDEAGRRARMKLLLIGGSVALIGGLLFAAFASLLFFRFPGF